MDTESKNCLKETKRISVGKDEFESLFNNSPIGLYRTTPCGKILLANPALVRMLGFTSFDELSIRNLEAEGYTNLSETRENFKRRLEENGELTGYENAWLKNDGSIIYVRENVRLIREPDGSVLYEGTVENITEKKLAEDALKESEERFRILFDGNPDPVLLANPSTCSIMDANRSACILLEYEREELIGKHFSELAVPERMDISLAAFHTIVREVDCGKRIAPYPGYLMNSEKKSIPVEIMAQMITISGEKVLYGVFRDLSERKRIENALMESEENYRLLFESSMDAIFLTSPDGSIYQANPAACQMLGYSEEEIKKLGRRGIVDTNDPNLQIILDERERTGKFFGELSYVRKDGRIVKAEISTRLFRLADGSKRSCIIARDITAKKEAEENLKDSLEFNAKFFESSPIGIAIYKASGQCISANENFGKIIGAGKEQVLSQNFHKIESWKKYGIYPVVLEVLENETEVHKEVHMVTTFGRDVWIDLNVVVFYSRGEKHLLMMNYDITKRKRTEETLKISEERFRRIFNEGPLGMAVVGLDYKFVNVNSRLSQITGYSQEDLERLTFADITYPDDLELDLREAKRLLEGEAPFYSINKRYIKKNLEVVWINLTGTIIRNPDGEPLYFLALIEDISEKKSSEEALIRNEQLTRSILNSLTSHVAVIDKEGWIITVNRAWSEFALSNGSSSDLGIGVNYLDACLKASSSFTEAEAALNGIKAVLNGSKEKFSLEYTCHSPEERRWFLMNVTPLPSGGATISHSSITQNKLAEKEIRRNGKLLRTIIDTLPAGVIVADSKGNIFLTNNEAGRIWGGTKYVDLSGYGHYKAWWYPSGKPVTPGDWALARAVTRGESSFNETISIESFDGTRKIIQNSAVPIFDVDGMTINGAVAVLQDITQKIEMENIIAQSEKRFRSLIQNSTDVIILLDSGGITRFISPSVERVTGFIPEELLGQNGLDSLIPQEKEAAKEIFLELLNRPGEAKVGEFQVLHKKGHFIWIEVTAVNLLDEPGINAIVVNYRDINERKMAQLKLLESEERLKELNESKDKFFSIIAHDLKSPFTSLLGLSEFLANDFESLSGDEVKNFSLNIYKSAKGVFNLLENLLQWSSFQTGRMDFSPSTFRINELIEQTLSLYRVNSLRKKIRIENYVDENLEVFADRYMIDTVIRNIISNAIKFTPPAGEITITARYERDWAEIAICDNGIGISRDNMERLFNLGERVTTPGTGREKGTGLGLILCREFVEKNRGKMDIVSTEGKGTKFTLYLPVR